MVGRYKSFIYAKGFTALGRGLHGGVVHDRLSSRATDEGRKDDLDRVVQVEVEPSDWRFLLSFMANRPHQYERALREVVRAWDEADRADSELHPGVKPWRERGQGYAGLPTGNERRLRDRLKDAMPDD